MRHDNHRLDIETLSQKIERLIADQHIEDQGTLSCCASTPHHFSAISSARFRILHWSRGQNTAATHLPRVVAPAEGGKGAHAWVHACSLDTRHYHALLHGLHQRSCHSSSLRKRLIDTVHEQIIAGCLYALQMQIAQDMSRFTKRQFWKIDHNDPSTYVSHVRRHIATEATTVLCPYTHLADLKQ